MEILKKVMSKGKRHWDEQHPFYFIHHCLVFNHDMAPFLLSPFAKNQPALRVRRGDLHLIGPTTWQILLCHQQYIFTLRHTHRDTRIYHTLVLHTNTHILSNTHTNTKNECFRWWGRQLTIRVTDCIVHVSFGGCNKHQDIRANKSRIGSVINQSADSWLQFVCPTLCIISDWISAN